MPARPPPSPSQGRIRAVVIHAIATAGLRGALQLVEDTAARHERADRALGPGTTPAPPEPASRPPPRDP